ncbi:hypothetical protein [uncultured Pseudonocardia sp.]|uniref:hypothetical protein n=1 Tax=uncultured Pseudonocardia sp. TaxID=211455 RepID=UPI00262478DD|nr:hypothetical protein [uncultured Pseudonocardia sp.]
MSDDYDDLQLDDQPDDQLDEVNVDDDLDDELRYDAAEDDGALRDVDDEADADRTAALQDVHFGTSWTVDGTSEAGNPVEWSTTTNAYHDEKTGEQVEPK